MNIIFRSTIMLLFLSALVWGKAPDWNTFESGLTKSKARQKMMIVSVYTDWCSWCKKMESQTFTDQQVADYLNQKYIPIKMNAESETRLTYNGYNYTYSEFVKQFGITGYPATIFFNEKQQPITVVPGFIPSKEFIKILKYFGENEYNKRSFEDYSKSYK